MTNGSKTVEHVDPVSVMVVAVATAQTPIEDNWAFSAATRSVRVAASIGELMIVNELH